MNRDRLLPRLALAAILLTGAAKVGASKKYPIEPRAQPVTESRRDFLPYEVFVPLITAETQPVPPHLTQVGHPRRRNNSCETWELTDDNGEVLRTFDARRHPDEEKELDKIASQNPPGLAIVDLMRLPCVLSEIVEIDEAFIVEQFSPIAYAYLPLVSNGLPPKGGEQSLPGKYTGWLASRGYPCELWELQNAPSGGKPVVVFNSRSNHVEHRLLQSKVGGHMRVDLKEWECLGERRLDVTGVELLP